MQASLPGAKMPRTSILHKSAANGSLLISFSALLWATDALVRFHAIDKVDPTMIVLIEHILAVLVMIPLIINKFGKEAFALSPQQWIASALTGFGGSALALVYFTASFAYVNPSVAVLLQKFQPVMVVVIAFFILGERPNSKFYFWSIIALAAGVVLSFPNLDFNFINSVDLHSKGIRYALLAALMWAISTVAGKILLKKTSPTLATFWRFFFGLVGLSFISIFSENHSTSFNWALLSSGSTPWALLYLSLVPGLLAIFMYYSGLARTTASIATFVELVYPIGAVILNTLFLHTPLEPIQLASGFVLIAAVTLISI